MSIGAKWLLINGRFYTRIFFDRDSFPRVKETRTDNKKPSGLAAAGLLAN